MKAKHHKISRGPSNTNTSNPLELVHMDVCGPFQEASLGGSRYLATFVDDYSSMSVVCPVKAKSDVAGVTIDVINMLEKQSKEFSYGKFGGGRGPHVGAVCNGFSDRCCTRPLPVYGQPSEAFLRRNRGSFYADQFLKR